MLYGCAPDEAVGTPPSVISLQPSTPLSSSRAFKSSLSFLSSIATETTTESIQLFGLHTHYSLNSDQNYRSNPDVHSPALLPPIGSSLLCSRKFTCTFCLFTFNFCKGQSFTLIEKLFVMKPTSEPTDPAFTSCPRDDNGFFVLWRRDRNGKHKWESGRKEANGSQRSGFEIVFNSYFSYST